MKILLAGLLSVALLAAQQESAPDASVKDATEKADLIRDILRTSRTDVLTKAAMSQLVSQMMPAAMKDIPPAVAADFVKTFGERLQNLDIAEFAIPAYSKRFSVDELKAILAFNQSPAGQKLAAVGSEMQAELMQKGREMGQQIAKEVAMEVVLRHPEYVEALKQKAAAQANSGAAAPAAPHANLPAVPEQLPPGTAALKEIEFDQASIRKVPPAYPPLAKAGRVTGAVHLRVLIATDGSVTNISLISGHPLLIQAAMDAVSQWRFPPTVRNGVPVQVITEAEINFSLSPTQ